ncbi:hypothetical protein [Pseudomonas sp. FP1742]|uniref:hypothetical protein n=1 Tax=Pseudomonas sp. FP1742 TaxID=2954079 RepID=UPI00273230E6|nr:hypothetical protein [Pseudomonas sp. FP1742]WLG53909.1 hypothetical protein PSH64_01010 [Pseudomonas sp. FP1742]
MESASAAATWLDVIKPKTGVEMAIFWSADFAVVSRFESWAVIVIDGPLWLWKVTGPSIYAVYSIKETSNILLC